MTTFSPAPGAATTLIRVRAQAAMETRLLLRNGEQLLLAVVIPVIVLIGGVAGAERVGIEFDSPAVDVLAPGVIALAIMSTAFTSLAIATGFERRYGVIKRLGASPLTRADLVFGKVGALVAVIAVQVVVIGSVGVVMGWRPDPALLPLGATALLGTAAFASLGLAMAGALRAEATLAAANLVYLLLLAGGAVVLPVSAYGSFGDLVTWLPSGALGEAMRAAFDGGLLTDSVRDLAVLAGWATIGTVITARTFQWD